MEADVGPLEGAWRSKVLAFLRRKAPWLDDAACMDVIQEVAKDLLLLDRAGVVIRSRSGLAVVIAARRAGRERLRRRHADVDQVDPVDPRRVLESVEVADLLASLPEPLQDLAAERLAGLTLRESARLHSWTLWKTQHLLELLQGTVLRLWGDPRGPKGTQGETMMEDS